jgi:hypothetical protein
MTGQPPPGWWQASDGNWYPPQPVTFLPPPLGATPPTYNTMAIISIVCAITLCGVGSIPAVILGHLAKKQIRESGGAEKGDELATAGLVIGYIGLAVMVIVVPLQLLVYLAV